MENAEEIGFERITILDPSGPMNAPPPGFRLENIFRTFMIFDLSPYITEDIFNTRFGFERDDLEKRSVVVGDDNIFTGLLDVRKIILNILLERLPGYG